MVESMIKKAMIMAAGVGSRLGAVSDILPKPLVPVANIPVMDILLKNLASFGINDVIANTFYKSEYIQERYKTNDFGINVNFKREKELSGTAGGLKKCESFLSDTEDFIVMSGDGLSDINIESAYESHKCSSAIATIVTTEVPHSEVFKYGIIVPDRAGIIESFQEKPTCGQAKSNLVNTGIYIFKREIFDFIPPNMFYDFAKNVFTTLLKNGIKINTYNHRGYWSDIGSISQYKQSNFDVLDNKISSIDVNINTVKTGKFTQGENTIIDKSVMFTGNNVIGSNCVIGKDCAIKNSIIWDNVKIKSGVTIEDSIVLSDKIVEYSVKSEIISQ